MNAYEQLKYEIEQDKQLRQLQQKQPLKVSRNKNSHYSQGKCIYCDDDRCDKCIITQLRKKVFDLEQQLNKLNTQNADKLLLSYYEKQLLQHYLIIERNTGNAESMPQFEYKSKLSHAFFCTLTFDPSKFGTGIFHSERRLYILSRICTLMDKMLIKECYGSFEFHKNGQLHSHMIFIMNPDDKKIVKQLLKKEFTDNPYNKNAIDIGPAKYPTGMTYIEKESDDFFYIMHKPRKYKHYHYELPTEEESRQLAQDLDYGL